MDPKEISKKKNDLLKSIMSNTKLSKIFREAMGSSIGSTKRAQAQSVLSVIKKVGGFSNDGKGGPGIVSPQETPSVSEYSNMMIFPAAPKFKTNSVMAPDGQGGPIGDLFKGYKPLTISNSPFSFMTPQTSTPSTPAPAPITTPSSSVGTGLNYTPANFNPIPQKSSPSDFPNLASTVSSTAPSTPAPFYPTPTGTPIPTDYTPTPPSETPTAPVGTVPGAPARNATIQGAQKAVDQGTGAGFYAYGATEGMFEGGFDNFVKNIKNELSTKYNLEPLETELSNLKAMKGNLVPTLKNYMSGKDQYLRFIDKMIEQSQGRLATLDIGDPVVAREYKANLDYLYTLKGRQSQRYSNFLNSAIADYNADLERAQSNYDNNYKRYADEVNLDVTLSQNKYNTLMGAFSDMYTSLEEAPMKREALTAMRLENFINGAKAAELLEGGSNTDEKLLKKTSEFINFHSNDEGGLDLTTLGAGEFIELFQDANYMEDNGKVAAKGLNILMANSIQNSGGDPSVIFKFNRMISDLAAEENRLYDNLNIAEEDRIFVSDTLRPGFERSSKGLVSEFVLDNLGDIKGAAKELVKGGRWTSREPGLNNKGKWMEDNRNLGDDFLESMFSLAERYVTLSDSSTSDKFLDILLAGNNDREIANNVEYVLLVQ
ncbi:MAG TPA: hypothetical protein ENH99_01470 [Candidatus Pacearchaeota archaeon]|nr:hypothetical protein [Candidatus Pacearchaeota archaeon]